MKIQLIHNGRIPALRYGGTERVIWYLGRELARMGHRVSYLVHKGSQCDFGQIIEINDSRPLTEQIPADTDVVHFNDPPAEPVEKPHIVTIHGNIGHTDPLNINCVFVSCDHARRHGSESFVYNGLDWDDYGKVSLDNRREYYHFLGKAAWRKKNVRGAIGVVKALPGEKLYVLGGTRLNLKMGFRFTATPRARFFGMVGGEEKNALLQGSKGLIFPVRWPEPFGLAITESLFFGCPVFGTPYGSLPELVIPEVGFLADSLTELAAHIRQSAYDRRICHEYARDRFNSKIMAHQYLACYERVLNGETLNPIPPRALKPHDGRLPWNG